MATARDRYESHSYYESRDKGRAEHAAQDMRDGSHEISVGWEPNNHGYPYRATCACGWVSMPYVARHAAATMGDYHLSDTVVRLGV